MNEAAMQSTLAGAWYSDNPARLKRELDACLQTARPEARDNLFAVILPHAGYAYSGPCAAWGAKAIAGVPGLRRVVVLGFTHRLQMPGAASVPSREQV